MQKIATRGMPISIGEPGRSESSWEAPNAPRAEAMCVTADWRDMKPARSSGAGTFETSVLTAMFRSELASMKITKTTSTGSGGFGIKKPTETSAMKTVAPMPTIVVVPKRSTSGPPRRVTKKLSAPPTRYRRPIRSRG
jgi:hypothetical protein